MTKTIKTQGFTIIELLFVLVLAGVTVFGVYRSVGNLKQDNRDAKRTKFVDLTSAHLEYVYGTKNTYPTQAQLLDSSEGGWQKTNLKGFDTTVLTDPDGIALGTENSDYTYTALPAECNGADVPCTSFELKAKTENAGEITKSSLPK